MPSNRRHTRQAPTETPTQNDPIVTPEGTELEHGARGTPTPAATAEDSGQEEQAEGQNAGEEHATEEQTTGETPAPVGEQQDGLPMTVRLHTGAPVEDVVATADVTLGDVCTIRNVKIKEDDYGLKVVMPRTRMPDTGRFKDACYFHTPELREQFDAAVKEAYQQTLEPAQEQGGMGGMTL